MDLRKQGLERSGNEAGLRESQKQGKFWLGGWGAATLPVVMIIGGVVLELTIVSSFVAYTISRSGLGERATAEALSTARSGAMDAVRRVIRNKDFSDADGYVLDVGGHDADVVAVKDFPEVGVTRITSTGTVLFRQKKIQADLSVNATTGEVRVVSFKEVSL